MDPIEKAASFSLLSAQTAKFAVMLQHSLILCLGGTAAFY